MTDKDKPKGPPRSKAASNRPAGRDERRPGKPAFGKGDRKPAFGKDGGKDGGKDRPARPPRDDKPRRAPVDAPFVAASDEPVAERISKIMARAGVASRRDCERLIMEGRVRLNGKVLDTPAVTCTLNDTIEVDGEPIRGIERTRLWLYHKPAGLVTTNSDPEGRPTVFDNLPGELPRVMSIGRLDINTEGLLLLTNDGGLARVLELPATGWLRRYRVRAHGEIEQAQLDALKDGIAVDGVLYAGIEATLDRVQGHNVWITMGLREGKNREIKNVLGALGLDVNRLIRVSYGPFQLGDLDEGAVVEVRSKMLRDQLGPRLIADSKANFDAPILNMAPVAADEEPAAERPQRRPRADAEPRDEVRSERPARAPREERAGGRDERPRRDFGDRDNRDRGERPMRDRNDRDRPDRDNRDRDARPADDKQKRLPLGTTRTSNVWRAPDARPAKAEARPEKGDVLSAGKKVVVAYKEKDPDAAPAKPKPRKPRANRLNEERGERRERPQRTDDRPRRAADDSRSGERRRDDGPSDRPKRAFAKPEGRDGARSERPARDGKPFAKRSDDGARSDRPARDGKPFAKRSDDGARSERPARDGKPFAKGPGKPGGKPAGRPGSKPGGKPTGKGPGAGRNADRRR